MATLSITAAEVTAATSGVGKVIAQFGDTITAGMTVYLAITGGSAGKWLKAVSTSAEASGVGTQVGIALCNGVDTQWGVVATSGPVTLEASSALMVLGTHYYVSSTAGVIGERTTDVGTGNKVTDLGYATTQQILTLVVNATGLTSA